MLNLFITETVKLKNINQSLRQKLISQNARFFFGWFYRLGFANPNTIEKYQNDVAVLKTIWIRKKKTLRKTISR